MNKGCFTSESLRGNKFALGNKPNKTSFKKNHTPFNFLGSCVPRVVKHSRDGEQVIVTVNKKKTAVSRNRVYETRKRISYAQYIMKTPKGMVTYHIDGDPLNNDKNNLRVITRAELLKLNRGKRGVSY